MAFRKSKVNIKWSNNFAYALGVIATDGNVSPDMRHINITSKDKEMLVNIKKCLNITNKIGKKARGGSKEKKYYVLQFGDVNFYNFLLSIGIKPKKSKTIATLNIPKKYFSDFFRGCIDGDGNISISMHPESTKPQYKVRLYSASLEFLKWMLPMCIKVFKLKSGTITGSKNSIMYTMRFGKDDSIKILKMTYLKNVICLSRKKKVVLQILNNIGRVA